MFKELIYSHRSTTPVGYKYNFRLVDSCFQLMFEVTPSYEFGYLVAEQIIKIYSAKHLNVIKNLAAYYEYMAKSGINPEQFLEEHFERISYHLGYQNKYYPLLTKYYLTHYVRKPNVAGC